MLIGRQKYDSSTEYQFFLVSVLKMSRFELNLNALNKITLTLLLIFGFGSLLAQSDSSITHYTNRNGFTPVAKTLPKGNVLIDLGISVDQTTLESENENFGDRKLWSFPNAHIGYGLAKRWTIYVDFTVCQNESNSFQGFITPEVTYAYLGTYQTGAKFHVVQQKRFLPEIALMGGFQGIYRQTEGEITNLEFTPNLQWLFNYEIGKYLEFGGSFYSALDLDAFPFTATMRIHPNEKVGLIISYINFATKYNAYSNVINQGSKVVDFGAYVQLMKKMRLDFHVIPELDRYPYGEDMDEYHFTFGISAMF